MFRRIVLLYFKHIETRLMRLIGQACLFEVKNKGINIRFHGRVKVIYPDNLIIGNHVRVGSNCYFFCKGGLEIGDNTQISRNVTIYTANHNYDSNIIPFDDKYIHNKVKIGKSVWIGMNVSIIPGVEIGDGAIIGIGTIVSSNVEPGAIVCGYGSRVIRYRDNIKFQESENNTQYFGKLFPNK